MDEILGFVGLPAHRRRREKRRIRLYEEPVVRNVRRDLPNIVRRLEGDNTGDGNVRPEVEKLPRELPRAREAMYHRPGRRRLEDVERVIVRRARMDYCGKPQLRSSRNLLFEKRDLPFARTAERPENPRLALSGGRRVLS